MKSCVRKIQIIVTVSVCGLVSLLNACVVHGVGDEAEISWTKSRPSIYSAKTTAGYSGSCMKLRIPLSIYGDSEKRDVCMHSNENIKFGSYFDTQRTRWAIGFAPDETMYKFDSVCDINPDNCKYLPNTDTLVVRQNYSTQYPNGRILFVYRNFTKRLFANSNAFGLIQNYGMDTSNPDYKLVESDGRAWHIGPFGVSNNERWLALEFETQGLGLLDLQTFEMKHFARRQYKYGLGFNAFAEFAVSNDGRHVAVVGLNAGFKVFDVDASCGQALTDDVIINERYLNNPCPVSNAGNFDYMIDRFNYAVLPRFSEDGGELSFFAYLFRLPMKEVVARANGYNPKPMDYIALGDSYTSGEGEDDDKYYLKGTNEEFEKCHVSYRSYPFLISDLMSIEQSNMASVACSGAEMDDVVGDDASYWGQGGRFDVEHADITRESLTIAQTEARESFLPGRVHQLNFVELHKPKIVTIGIGGNDAGFMEKLKDCVAPNTCDWASSESRRQQAAQEIKSLFPEMVETYKAIHDKSMSSKIYVIGYPRIIDENGECGLANEFLLDKDERKFINEGVSYLNQVIEAAAKRAGLKYVDISDSYGGHVLCGGDEPAAMNAIRLGDDFGPGGMKILGSESFHPNPIGHGYASNSIYDKLGSLIDFNYCDDGSTYCPNDSILAPNPSSYWVPNGYQDVAMLKKSDFAIGIDTSLQREVSVPPGSFAPNSLIQASVRSTPRNLGSFSVDDDGASSFTVSLPSDIEEGDHTLYLSGISFSGKKIELYQPIRYGLYRPAPQEQSGQISGDTDSFANSSDQAVVVKNDTPDQAKPLAQDMPTNDASTDTLTDVPIDKPIVVEIPETGDETNDASVKGDAVEIPHLDSIDQSANIHKNINSKSEPAEPISSTIFNFITIVSVVGATIYLYRKLKG